MRGTCLAFEAIANPTTCASYSFTCEWSENYLALLDLRANRNRPHSLSKQSKLLFCEQLPTEDKSSTNNLAIYADSSIRLTNGL